MAATVQSEADDKVRSGFEQRPRPARCTRPRAAPHGAAVMSVLLASALWAGPLQAQQWRLESTVASNLTWTSNALLGLGAAQSDVLIDVTPRFAIRGEGSRLRVAGSTELTVVNYVNGSRASRFAPVVDLSGRLEAIDDVLFIEGGVRSLRDVENAFGVHSNTGSSGVTRSTREVRLSPYL
jgi:uncharacterized protein (PEP-CTERM system associated)